MKILLKIPLLLAASSVLLAVPTSAENGPYITFEAGAGVGSSMTINATDNDVATTCDGWIVPGIDPVEPKAPGCNPPPATWSSRHGDGAGMAGGLGFGYRFGNIRGEIEFVHSALTYNDTADLTATDDVTVDKAQQELEFANTTIETVLTESFFLNAYWDFRPDEKLNPFLGLGFGVANVSIGYNNRWKRNLNPEAITTFAGHPDEENLRRIVAGTTTIANETLKDDVPAYQLLAGIDFKVSESITLGVKARVVEYGAFKSHRFPWDQLRSHHSSWMPGHRNITYGVSTDDLRTWGLSFGLKAWLGR